MVRIPRLTVVSRDPDLVRRGHLPWARLDITLRWLYTSSWQITLPATPRVLDRCAPGWGVLVYLDGEQILSGSAEDIDREADHAAAGTVEITGADDLAIVAGELAYPDPTSAATSQSAASHDSRSGAAETVIKGYVAANVGTSRAAARKDAAAPDVREVTVAPDQARGNSVSYKARFDPLMEIVRTAHGGLGVSCAQDGTDLVFDVIEPTDRSASATFSFAMGNLRRARWNRGYPEATHVVVAGDGEGTARAFRERSDAATAEEWRMITRVFKDQRHTSDATELDQAGDEELAKAARSGILAAELIDTPRLTYGAGYRLGDRVTISPEPGVVFTDVITSVRITADAESGDVTITPSIGFADGGPYETRQERAVREVARRIGALERSL
ncbi:siphovirus ReqiPepy6 Gp37-like family protein [Nocardiopsis sp. FR26]|uniref:siphovirus ReqiPepy6 Gp37-like family protein n=1 Tax=Nocardiopsis sp. FR26 TaxID=2605987 RepID=UPI00135C87FE|nr:siphovirus ReqiPepy6 Gp37-like family protein [Nocardiopsis sp. FR26]